MYIYIDIYVIYVFLYVHMYLYTGGAQIGPFAPKAPSSFIVFTWIQSYDLLASLKPMYLLYSYCSIIYVTYPNDMDTELWLSASM